MKFSEVEIWLEILSMAKKSQFFNGDRVLLKE